MTLPFFQQQQEIIILDMSTPPLSCVPSQVPQVKQVQSLRQNSSATSRGQLCWPGSARRPTHTRRSRARRPGNRGPDCWRPVPGGRLDMRRPLVRIFMLNINSPAPPVVAPTIVRIVVTARIDRSGGATARTASEDQYEENNSTAENEFHSVLHH